MQDNCLIGADFGCGGPAGPVVSRARWRARWGVGRCDAPRWIVDTVYFPFCDAWPGGKPHRREKHAKSGTFGAGFTLP
jgi:hypothetical protein